MKKTQLSFYILKKLKHPVLHFTIFKLYFERVLVKKSEIGSFNILERPDEMNNLCLLT